MTALKPSFPIAVLHIQNKLYSLLPFHINTMAGLARHVDPEDLIKTLRDHPAGGSRAKHAVSHQTPYSSRYASATELSKFRIPHDGAPADVVHQLLKDELDLDGVRDYNFTWACSFTYNQCRNQA